MSVGSPTINIINYYYYYYYGKQSILLLKATLPRQSTDVITIRRVFQKKRSSVTERQHRSECRSLFSSAHSANCSLHFAIFFHDQPTNTGNLLLNNLSQTTLLQSFSFAEAVGTFSALARHLCDCSSKQKERFRISRERYIQHHLLRRGRFIFGVGV